MMELLPLPVSLNNTTLCSLRVMLVTVNLYSDVVLLTLVRLTSKYLSKFLCQVRSNCSRGIHKVNLTYLRKGHAWEKLALTFRCTTESK